MAWPAVVTSTEGSSSPNGGTGTSGGHPGMSVTTPPVPHPPPQPVTPTRDSPADVRVARGSSTRATLGSGLSEGPGVGTVAGLGPQAHSNDPERSTAVGSPPRGRSYAAFGVGSGPSGHAS